MGNWVVNKVEVVPMKSDKCLNISLKAGLIDVKANMI